MNPIAEELNEIIKNGNPAIYDLLSRFGKEIYFPKGILFQGGEAKKLAKKYNATIGIATEKGQPMHLKAVMDNVNDMAVGGTVGYSPASGKPELRTKWKEEMIMKNPSLKGKNISLPVVTQAMTHGLSLVGDLFVNKGDTIILPDKIWGNYRLIYSTRKEANISTYTLFDGKNLNLSGIQNAINAVKGDKVILIFNFPNNPTGYSILKNEAEELVKILNTSLNEGKKILAVTDDAYFGMFYYEDVLKESLFGKIANLHQNLLAVKLDGATKEDFVWGLRVGFITYGAGNTSDEVYESLIKKTMGAIRSNISNCPTLSQSIILKAHSNPDIKKQRDEKIATLEKRARLVMEENKNEEYLMKWTPYPFNSGYFMCINLKTVKAEELRRHLLEKYQLGIIALGETDVRIAFSCLEEESIPDVFKDIYNGILDLEKK